MINSSDPDFSKVIDIKSTAQSFAALREDKTVISWGSHSYGGNKKKLTNVEKLESNRNSFTAILSTGEIVTWGNNNNNVNNDMGVSNDGGGDDSSGGGGGGSADYGGDPGL